MSFKTYLTVLTEVFDKPLRWKETSFTDGKRFVFYTNSGQMIETIIYADDWGAEIIFYKEGSLALAADDEAFQVFATVKDIIVKNKTWLSSFDKISFSAALVDPSIIRLYAKFAEQARKMFKKDYVSTTTKYASKYFIMSNKKNDDIGD